MSEINAAPQNRITCTRVSQALYEFIFSRSTFAFSVSVDTRLSMNLLKSRFCFCSSNCRVCWVYVAWKPHELAHLGVHVRGFVLHGSCHVSDIVINHDFQ